MNDKPIKSNFKQKPGNMLWSTANCHPPLAASDTERPVAANVGLSVDEVAIRQVPLPPLSIHECYRLAFCSPLSTLQMCTFGGGSAPFFRKFLTRWRRDSFSSTRLYPAGNQGTEPPQYWKTENSLVPREPRTTDSGAHSLATVRAHSKSFCTVQQVLVVLGETRPLWSARIMDFTPRVNKQKSFLQSSRSTNVSYAMYIITSRQRVALLMNSKYRRQH